MKLLHLADLHLGKTVLEAPMLEEQEAFLKKILELVDERGVDAVLMAGDLYDRSVPPAEAVELLDGFLSALSGRGIPVLAAAGNHDSPERLDFGSRIFTRGGLYIAGRYRPELTRVRMADAHGPVDVTLLPFLRPVTVRAALSTAPQEQDGEKGEAGIRTTEDAVRRHWRPARRSRVCGRCWWPISSCAPGECRRPPAIPKRPMPAEWRQWMSPVSTAMTMWHWAICIALKG